MLLISPGVRSFGVLALALTVCLAFGRTAQAATDAGPSWGAIASLDGVYGYAFNHPTRAAAERAARAQCDRSAGRTGACAVRAYFDRSCGAFATGNYGEWGTAVAPTAAAASQAATLQCNNHLPTQPCKPLVSVCSPR